MTNAKWPYTFDHEVMARTRSLLWMHWDSQKYNFVLFDVYCLWAEPVRPHRGVLRSVRAQNRFYWRNTTGVLYKQLFDALPLQRLFVDAAHYNAVPVDGIPWELHAIPRRSARNAAITAYKAAFFAEKPASTVDAV
jgi:hypothetical protein